MSTKTTQDTPNLPLGAEGNEAEPTYTLEDILAEFRDQAEPTAESEETPLPEPEPPPDPPIQKESPKKIFLKQEKPKNEPFKKELPKKEWHPNEFFQKELSAAKEQFQKEQEKLEQWKRKHKAATGQKTTLSAAKEDEKEPSTTPHTVTLEDIVASTVDATKAELERQKDRRRRRAEKRRQKSKERKLKKQEAKLEVPEAEPEQSPREAAAFHKRRWQESRRGLFFSIPVLFLMWLPFFLEWRGVAIPYFQESVGNMAVWILVTQIILSLTSASVFHTAWEEWNTRLCTGYSYAAITNVVALLDAITLLALPGRSALLPLGGVAGTALVFSLWGLESYHRGMWETLRTASKNTPLCVADRCEVGIARGRLSSEGFVSRTKMESTASQWQRLLLPPLLAVSIVFALLSSVGQERGQDFLWCWSAILCASCSFVCPMAYCIPFARVARRLNYNGTAVAGQYGATVLSSASKIVVSDTDLFPLNSVTLAEIKLYGEEEKRAISYTAALATQGGGCIAPIFEALRQEYHCNCEPLEHFHVHDDNGLSGIIRGETVLVGPPVFMRHMAVRLPQKLPAKTAICLAVDGELTAVFSLQYKPTPAVEIALRALSRNGMQILLATRDGNITGKLIKQCYGTDGKATLPEITERLSLSDPRREATTPNGLIFRDGLLPFAELVALSRRLCQIVKIGNLLSVLGNVFGALLGFYLTFVGRSDILSPTMLLVYLLLWTVPMCPLLISVDRM